MNKSLALNLLNSGIEVAALATKALTAANNGDEAAAEAYLKQARQRFDNARDRWDAAPSAE